MAASLAAGGGGIIKLSFGDRFTWLSCLACLSVDRAVAAQCTVPVVGRPLVTVKLFVQRVVQHIQNDVNTEHTQTRAQTRHRACQWSARATQGVGGSPPVVRFWVPAMRMSCRVAAVRGSHQPRDIDQLPRRSRPDLREGPFGGARQERWDGQRCKVPCACSNGDPLGIS